MGDFKKNPNKPFGVRVPNKIRKRIAMHEKEEARGRGIFTRFPSSLKKALSLPSASVVKKRGSMWSRFADRVKKFLR